MALVGKYTDLTERDGFGRINTRRLKYTGKNLLADSYTYLHNEIAPGNWRETNFVASVSQTVGRDSVEFAYTYDNCGNIVKIERDGRNYRNYEYDGLNRLTAEDNYEVMRRYEWSYDDGGNITEKRVYILNGSGDDPIATIPYGYDSAWKDKLVSYNGNTGFAYDNLGNPTKYKGIDLTWTNVRRLASYGNNTFEYGADGIRFKKNNTTYTLDGNRILRETDGTKTLTYYYGTNGVIGFRYNNADYFYHKNLQGDVLAIYDTNGIKQAEYEYDAWGKVLNVINCECCCCDIGNINPFRYRSYYYDVETGLYYLQTRYYDPEVGRFINSDAYEYLGDGAELSNYNLFAYCCNNPVMGYDPEGTFWHIVAGAFLGAVVEVATTVISKAIEGKSTSLTDFVGAVVKGAISGAITATGFIPPKLDMALDVIYSGASAGYESWKKGDPVTKIIGETCSSALFSLTWSWLTGPSNGAEMMNMYKTSRTANKALKKGAEKMGKKAAKKLKRIAKEYGRNVIKNLGDDVVSAINEIIANGSWNLMKKSLTQSE